MMTKDAQTALNELVQRVGTVRKWLVALVLVKTAAAGVAFVTLYIGAYALADHYLHFGAAARVAALAAFAAGAITLCVLLVKSLMAHVSASAAARHIESKLHLDQQLQSAIEYYENKADYPYSPALAEYVILAVHGASENERFDRTVAKWQGRACAAAIAAGVIIAALFLHGHYAFFSTYVSRLAQPLSNVAPLPATTLVSITGDMVVEEDAAYSLAAEIHGRVPERGALEIAQAQGGPSIESSEAAEPMRSVDVFAKADEGKAPRFEAQPTCGIGSYRYRFAAAGAATDWHTLRISSVPGIKSITADVSLPRSPVVQPYTTEVKDYALSVLKGSEVMLEVEPTEPLSEATVTGINGEAVNVDTTDARAFVLKFKASRDGSIKFAFKSAAGIRNDKIPPLEVEAKNDEPPDIKLVSPEGNLLVTNVASVPISFEVTDDFGLKSAALKIEMDGAPVKEVPMKVEEGAKDAKGAYTLELEDTPLNVGDSALVYAEAEDVETGVEGSARHSPTKGEVYFIEVRPYRVNWFPPKMGTQQAQQSQRAGELREPLGLILEYTRAIIRKTWTLANNETFSADDLAKITSLTNDVNYCATQLGKHKADPRNSFIAPQLGECISSYSLASKQLAVRKPRGAVDPEKDAYRVLRKLVDEMDKLCPPGTATPPEMRDRLIVDENVHVKRYDSESPTDSAGRMADEISRTAAEEARMRESFKHFLNEDKRGPDYAQKTTDEKSWLDPNQSEPNESSPSPASKGTVPRSRLTVEGSLLAAPPGEATSSGSSPSATPSDRLKVFQAKQRALQAETRTLKDTLRKMDEAKAKAPAEAKGKASADAFRSARATAEGEIEHAENSMGTVQDSVARLYAGGMSDEKAAKVTDKALDAATQHLYNARDALAAYAQTGQTQDEKLALADELTRLADEYDRTQDKSIKDKLTADIKKAQDMLASQTASQQGSAKGKAAGSQGNGSGPVGPYIATTPNLTYDTSQPAAAARFLAMRFWTLALQAKKQPSKTSQEEPSSAQLHNVENTFYEEAAKYSKGQSER